MTIEELKQEKQNVEKQIEELLTEFQKRAGTCLKNLEMYSTTYRTINGKSEQEVKIKLKIDI